MPKKHFESPFAKNLIALMKEKGLGIRETAKLIEVSPSTLNSWRSGSPPTNFKAVQRLAEVLGTTFSFLLTGESDSWNNKQAPSASEVFDSEGVWFDGYARIRIERLIPKKKITGEK